MFFMRLFIGLHNNIIILEFSWETQTRNFATQMRNPLDHGALSKQLIIILSGSKKFI